MKYAIYISHTNSLKNKLHKDFYAYLQENERVLVSDISKLKTAITQKVEALNTLHSRCNPIKVYFTGNSKSSDCYIHSGTGINAQILMLKDKI